MEAVNGAVVKYVEGEEERQQSDRQESGGHLRPGHADHQDAIRRVTLGRPHGGARHPPAANVRKTSVIRMFRLATLIPRGGMILHVLFALSLKYDFYLRGKCL